MTVSLRSWATPSIRKLTFTVLGWGLPCINLTSLVSTIRSGESPAGTNVIYVIKIIL